MGGDKFDSEDLLKAAAAKAGHDDFGSDSYRAALEPLLHSIRYEMQLSDKGRGEMRTRIVDALANRLTLVAWEKAHPALAKGAVDVPIIILGLPRTGSSILLETLAAAPAMRTPLIWEVRDFSLVHDVQDAHDDARIQQIEAAIARKNEAVPGYAAIHYENPHIPMECVALTIVDLVSTQFSTIAWAPTYRAFLLGHDMRETYRWHRRALRFLQARAPGKRWVLKAPMHSLYIETLLETYPDAVLLQEAGAPWYPIPGCPTDDNRILHPFPRWGQTAEEYDVLSPEDHAALQKIASETGAARADVESLAKTVAAIAAEVNTLRATATPVYVTDPKDPKGAVYTVGAGGHGPKVWICDGDLMGALLARFPGIAVEQWSGADLAKIPTFGPSPS